MAVLRTRGRARHRIRCVPPLLEMSSNPLPKQSTSHHRPFISTKSNLTQVLQAMNMLTLLPEIKSTTTYSDVANTSIKTSGPERNPFYSIYWLAKEYKGHQIFNINQTQPSHLPQGFGTYPITMTPCKHTCTPSTNQEMPIPKQTIMYTNRPLSKMALPMEPLATLS